ncbi:MAG: hypothetical protein II304_07425 [Bacteroidales bacterium]|nr:hypothetical protein [Bacteroidales bacterium]
MLKVEVIERVHHTATLSDEDEQMVLDYIKANPETFEFMSDKDKIILAVSDLYADGDIDVYQDTVESDSELEDIRWSEFERRSAKEILNKV